MLLGKTQLKSCQKMGANSSLRSCGLSDCLEDALTSIPGVPGIPVGDPEQVISWFGQGMLALFQEAAFADHGICTPKACIRALGGNPVN